MEPTDVNMPQPSTVPVQPGTTVPTPEAPVAPAPGDKTDPALLLRSLQEEREKRRLLEEREQAILEENERLKASALPASGAFSDEGKYLEGKIGELEKALAETRTNEAKRDLQAQHPVLAEKWSDFEEFRQHPDNKGMNIRTAAKAYLIEQGAIEARPRGLEQPTGGTDRTAPPTAPGVMSAEDLKTLRETNFKKYQEMLQKGQIKV